MLGDSWLVSPNSRGFLWNDHRVICSSTICSFHWDQKQTWKVNGVCGYEASNMYTIYSWWNWGWFISYDIPAFSGGTIVTIGCPPAATIPLMGSYAWTGRFMVCGWTQVEGMSKLPSKCFARGTYVEISWVWEISKSSLFQYWSWSWSSIHDWKLHCG